MTGGVGLQAALRDPTVRAALGRVYAVILRWGTEGGAGGDRRRGDEVPAVAGAAGQQEAMAGDVPGEKPGPGDVLA